MPELVVHQALWSMDGMPLDEAARRIAAARFGGAAVRCMDEAFVADATATLTRHGLGWVGNALPRTPDALAEPLRLAARHGAAALNVIPLLRADDATAHAIIARWLDEAAEAGVTLHLETHRGGFAEDGFRLARLLESLPSLRLTADLSHLLLGHGIKPPFAEADLAMIARLLAASDAVHLRLSTSEQAQVSPAFPQHAPWLDHYRAWWRTLFDAFATRNPGRQPVVVTELGPPAADFPVTGRDGAELSDRFTDSILLATIARDIWREGGHA
ncbi:hypothetical protein ACE7GA_05400 [Roseomonas sp. CCTCC AB2023176]|uniref:hypothetical protein n=1 Tax=Roseomonas sp. CCTCC AB2023176 TaxID=3342640 RepID=UPI0035DAEEF7